MNLDRKLDLFYILHKPKQYSPKYSRKAEEQWTWINDQINMLNMPNRAYFDSLHGAIFVDQMRRIEERITDSTLSDDSTFEEQMMVRLARSGVVIEPTEDTNLWLECIFYLETNTGYSMRDAETKIFLDLVDKRDIFIAKRIDETLRQGETGFLFLGAHHSRIQEFLNPSINLVVHLGLAAPIKSDELKPQG